MDKGLCSKIRKAASFKTFVKEKGISCYQLTKNTFGSGLETDPILISSLSMMSPTKGRVRRGPNSVQRNVK